MKIILAPDSFKGTMSSETVSSILKSVITKKIPDAEVECIPIADGGEGITECLEKIYNGEKVYVEVSGPDFHKLKTSFLLCGKTAVVELAHAAGLPLVETKDAKSKTTYGVGELINEAEKRGAEKIILGLGGSATNDGGTGMAAAMGTKFFDSCGKQFIPVGKTLCNIDKIVFSKKHNVTALCDVRNPLYGENGAAYVYAPQKGASENDVKLLNDGLKHLADILTQSGQTDFDIPGSGAAGGVGAGVIAFLGGKLKRGIDAVLDAVNFDEKALTADYIITGEGSLDSQSFSGKVIDGIISRKQNSKVIAVVGISKITEPQKYGLDTVFETNTAHRPFEEIKNSAQSDLTNCAEKIADYLISQS